MFYGKFIKFEERPNPNRKTRYFDVYSLTGHLLGIVCWKTSWRKYWFEPCDNTGFDASCLSDIAAYLTILMEERKK